MKSKTVLIIFVTIFSLFFVSEVQGDEVRHHVIVCIDRSGSMRRGSGTSNSNTHNIERIKRLIDRVFRELQKENIALESRPMLIKGDYLSIVGFGLDHPNNPDDEFQRFISSESFEVSYRQIGEMGESTITRIAKQFTSGLDWRMFNKHWGIATVAQSLAIHHLANKGKEIHRTFLVLVNDDDYNAQNNDPLFELREVASAYRRLSGRSLDINKPINVAKLLRENYLWYGFPEGNPLEIFERKDNGEKIFARWFRYEPLQKFFSIESCYRFENRTAFFKRSFNNGQGGYSYPLEIVDLQNPNYAFRSLDAFVLSNGQIIEGFNYNQATGIPNIIQFQLEKASFGQADTIVLKFAMKFVEDAYGGTLLHPEGSELQGANGLVRKIPIVYEEDLSIFGFIPLNEAKYLNYASQSNDEQSDIVKKIERLYTFYLVMAILLALTVLLALYILRNYKTKNPKEII